MKNDALSNHSEFLMEQTRTNSSHLKVHSFPGLFLFFTSEYTIITQHRPECSERKFRTKQSGEFFYSFKLKKGERKSKKNHLGVYAIRKQKRILFFMFFFDFMF